MARIRSLHPGQWTDEDFVGMSMAARLLCLALRNEAFDDGVFEWKPVTIKMRCMPVDNVDIAALLEELEAANQVRSFEHGGRQYGAVRNFCRWQSPKKPNSSGVLPPELRTFVALEAASSELLPSDHGEVPNQSGTGSEQVRNSAGRGRGEEGSRRGKGVTTPPAESQNSARPDDPVRTPEARAVCDAAGLDVTTAPGWVSVDAEVAGWIADGCDLERDILPTVRARIAKIRADGRSPPSNPRYFAAAVADARTLRVNATAPGRPHRGHVTTTPPDTPATGDDIAARLRSWRSLVYDLDPAVAARIKAEITGVRGEAEKARALMAELRLTEADVDGRMVPEHLRAPVTSRDQPPADAKAPPAKRPEALS